VEEHPTAGGKKSLDNPTIRRAGESEVVGDREDIWEGNGRRDDHMNAWTLLLRRCAAFVMADEAECLLTFDVM